MWDFAITAGDKEALFFSNSIAEPRCVAHIRGYFDNQNFWSSWFPHNAEILDAVSLNDDVYDLMEHLKKSMLKDMAGMRKFIRENIHLNLCRDQFGYKTESDRYEYYIRLNPVKGDYNCYIYIYQK